MTGRLIEEARPVIHRAALGIVGSPDHATDTRVADRAGAHGARFQRYVQSEVRQSIILDRGRSVAQSHDFGVCCRIMACDWAILPFTYHFAGFFVHYHRADRHLASFCCRLRQIQCHAHEPLIMDRHPRDNDKKPRARQGDAPRGPRKFADKGPKFGSGDKKDRKFDDRGPRSRDENRPTSAGRGENRGPKTGKPAGKPATPERTERIAKALARAGIASRREVERLIGLGKVAVNGRILDTPAVLVKKDDVITVDGKPVGAAEATRVWRYHKPAGLITSHNDPAGRPTVWDALPADLPRVISVGRLDLATEGLLLLTNDGELSRALELPETSLVRQYRARARGRITQERLDKLKDGCEVDGVRYGPIEATIDKVKEKADGEDKGPANLWISVSITEGKNREVRKVLESVGLQVNRLIRLAYGPFNLGTLPVNTVEEVGPRVIRELLGEYIRPENLPTGNSVATPAPIPGRRPAGAIIKGRSGSALADPSRKPSRVRAAAKAAEEGVPEKPAKPVKKEGWAKAKPKFEHKKTFKPRARPERAEGEGFGGDRPRKPFNREPRADQFIDDRRKPQGRDGERRGGAGKPFGGKPGGGAGRGGPRGRS